MQRVVEPELMDDSAQVIAYTKANFEEAHSAIVNHFDRVFPRIAKTETFLDLGCGPADIAIRFAHKFPNCKVDAVDGAKNMLIQAQQRIESEALQDRIALYLCCLPECELPNHSYDVIVSNSLLHHLHEPQHLWSCLHQYASTKTAVFISDLIRPESQDAAELLVNEYAVDEPEILRRDFYNSLLAAFTIDEAQAQLNSADLNSLSVEKISDRHMLIHGYIK